MGQVIGEDVALAKHSFEPQRLERLLDLKRKWDPENMFRPVLQD